MKALVGAFNQEKALVGAFSVIIQPVVEPMDRFTALLETRRIMMEPGCGDRRQVNSIPPLVTGHPDQSAAAIIQNVPGTNTLHLYCFLPFNYPH